MAKPSDPVSAYAVAVTRKRVMAGPYVRLAAKRHQADRKRKDLRWYPDRAQKAIDFFAEMLPLEDGSPFMLQGFQKFIVGSVFGWYMPDGRRRFRSAYVEIAKGNGKTPMAAGIGLYGVVADGEPSPEVYVAATMREQARICFKDAVRMVEASPELADLVDVQAGSLSIPKEHAVLRAVSSEHKGLDGLRVHVGLIDELHEHPTATVVDKIRAGTKRRPNALIFEITNSGWDRTSVCWAHHELSVKVLEGTVENDQWFAYVCALDHGDSWQDEKVWLKVNPGLKTILPMSYLREQVEEAVGMPSKENIVRRLNFCEWTEQADRWLDMQAWEACGREPVNEAALKGQRCMAGLDMNSTNDLAAFAMLFGPDDAGRYRALLRFWIPEDSLSAKESGRTEADRLMLKAWADHGLIRTTPGNVTDYDLVEEQLLADLKTYPLSKLAFDRWNVTQLVTHLKDHLGEARVIDFAQSFQGMSAPSKEFEKLIASGRFLHGGNPVLRWMASNVALRFGPDGQIKPDRQKSRDKIDGIVASIMALGQLMREPEKKPSIYDQRIARGEEVLTRL